jgi:hypothetical protein
MTRPSSLKWKEYKTYSKFSGKFGFWETEYKGLRIDLSPFDRLVAFMEDSNTRTLAGIELMAFSSEQLESILDKQEENEENTSSLEALEHDPIPVENVYKNQSMNHGNRKNTVEVEPWEELEPMAEGQVRVMNRQFVYIEDVEIEVCTNDNGKYFVRHNVYWWIMHNNKNPHPETNCVIRNLQNVIDRLPTIRWSGYRFRFETIIFSEDDVEVDSLLLPLAMFEDLIKDKLRFNTKVIEQILNGEYQASDYEQKNIKLFVWLQSNSILSLIENNKA